MRIRPTLRLAFHHPAHHIGGRFSPAAAWVEKMLAVKMVAHRTPVIGVAALAMGGCVIGHGAPDYGDAPFLCQSTYIVFADASSVITKKSLVKTKR